MQGCSIDHYYCISTQFVVVEWPKTVHVHSQHVVVGWQQTVHVYSQFVVAKIVGVAVIAGAVSEGYNC